MMNKEFVWLNFKMNITHGLDVDGIGASNFKLCFLNDHIKEILL